MLFASISARIGPVGVVFLKDIKEPEKLVLGKIVTSVSGQRSAGISTCYLKKSKNDEVMSYPVKGGVIKLRLLLGKYVITEWSRPWERYGRIQWRLDVPSGEEGGVNIVNIISSRGTRDYTVSVEGNELSGRECRLSGLAVF